MIKEIGLNKWKSFSDATLFVDSVTVLIGTNASGKSNALDALLFLKRIATGMSFTAALQGDQSTRGIRGGLEWASLDKNGKFSIEAKVEGSDERTDYVYRVECVVEENRCDLASESLQRLKYRSARRSSESRPYSISLFSTDACASDAASITARLYNEKRGSPRPSLRSGRRIATKTEIPICSPAQRIETVQHLSLFDRCLCVRCRIDYSETLQRETRKSPPGVAFPRGYPPARSAVDAQGD